MVILSMTQYNIIIRVELYIAVIVATCWKEVIPECAKEMVNGLEPHQYASVRLIIVTAKVFDTMYIWLFTCSSIIMHVHRVKCYV